MFHAWLDCFMPLKLGVAEICTLGVLLVFTVLIITMMTGLSTKLYDYITGPWHGNTFVREIHKSLVDFPYKVPIMQNFDVFFIDSLTKLLSTQYSCQWFEMPWPSCGVPVMSRTLAIYPHWSHHNINVLWSKSNRSLNRSAGIILCMCPANERQCYNVMSSLIGWAHTQNDPWKWLKRW